MSISNKNLSWLLILISAFCEIYAGMVVKLLYNELGLIDFNSLNNTINYFLEFMKSPLLITAGFAFFLSPALWFIALNRIELSIGYPVLVVFHLIFTVILSVTLLEESFDLYKMIAFALVLISLYCFRKEVE